MDTRMWRAIALVSVAALGGVLIWQHRLGTRSGIVADPDGVLKEVRPLKELVSVRYSIQKVEGLREDKDPVGSESILLIVQAKVLGGVDLGELQDRDITMEGAGRVRMRLPKARILHVALDEKNTQVWDRSKTWWTPWVPYSLDLEKKARLAALASVEKEALDMGILKEAQTNAQTMIAALLRAAGLEVRFE